MSKRVEVREGDRFFTVSGMLLQHRGDVYRTVVDGTNLRSDSWSPVLSKSNPIPLPVARAWIESLGGEWAEVAEVERQRPQPVYAVDYMHENGTIWRAVSGSRDHNEMEAQIASGRSLYRRITIAGVTT